MKNKPLLIIGGGGHSAVLLRELLSQGRKVAGIVSPEPPTRESFHGFRVYASDEEVLNSFDPLGIALVNGVGSLPGHDQRKSIFQRFTEEGFLFETILAQNAIISEDVVLGHGVQVMAGAIIQPGVVISDNTIINTGAIVDHDCAIGSHNHIAPGSILSGGVRTGENVHIGTGACVIQSVLLGDNSVVGAGTSVVRDVPEKEKIAPASIRFLTS